MNPIYIWKLLTAESQRKAIQSLAAGAAGSMPNISKSNLREVLLSIPPYPLQDEFAAIVNKVERLKTRYQQSLTDLETLYGALSQKAFRGELDLSRVPLPAKPAEGEQPAAINPLPPQADASAIHLTETDLLPAALENRERLEALLRYWLEAYCGQLGDALFSVERFMVAAQTRLAELHPENDFALGTNDYEHIKAWVFEALAAGTLTQAFDNAGNRIDLKAVQA